MIGIIGEEGTPEIKDDVVTEPNELKNKNIDSEPACESTEPDFSSKNGI